MSVYIGTGYEGEIVPLSYPRLCWRAYTATATASTAAAGTSVDSVTDGETWSYWTAGAASSTLTLTFSALSEVGYIGLAAHNLGTIGATVRPLFQASSGGAFEAADDVPANDPEDDRAALWLFNARSVWGVRLEITGASAPATIAVAQAGPAMEIPRKSVYTGLPISEAEQIRYRQLQSIRGDVIGRATEGAELAFDVQINNLPEDFRRSADWQAFKAHMTNSGAFFIAPKPGQYPDDVAYARVTERARFERALANRNASGTVTLRCAGYLAP